MNKNMFLIFHLQINVLKFMAKSLRHDYPVRQSR